MPIEVSTWGAKTTPGFSRRIVSTTSSIGCGAYCSSLVGAPSLIGFARNTTWSAHSERAPRRTWRRHKVPRYGIVECATPQLDKVRCRDAVRHRTVPTYRVRQWTKARGRHGTLRGSLAGAWACDGAPSGRGGWRACAPARPQLAARLKASAWPAGSVYLWESHTTRRSASSGTRSTRFGSPPPSCRWQTAARTPPSQTSHCPG